MSNTIQFKNISIKLWLQAIRPFSLTATFIPLLFAVVLTLYYFNTNVDWFLLIFIIIGTPFFQIAGNLFSEYFDFINKVDRKDTFGSSRVLVDGLIEPKSVFWGGLLSTGVLLFIGAILTYFRGLEFLIIGITGIIGSYIYSKLKYRALGDLHIFISFGPLMIFGIIYALTGSYHLLEEIIIMSFPIAFLVTAILHANNTRDLKHDSEAKIFTLASVLGLKKSIYYYDILLLGSYLTVLLLIILHVYPIWTLLVFSTLPIAINNIKLMHLAKEDNLEIIKMLDVMTAQLHTKFGLLLSLGFLIGFMVR